MAKKRCWACGSRNVIRWGKQNNKQRFKCKKCGIYFTNNKPHQVINNRYVWFKKWIIEKQTYIVLSHDSGYSIDTLRRTFHQILERLPNNKAIKRKGVNHNTNNIFLSKYYLIAYNKSIYDYISLMQFIEGKKHNEELKEELIIIITLAIKLERITINLCETVQLSDKSVVVQRCLENLQGMCLIWLINYPTHIAEQEFRKIILSLLRLKREIKKQNWINIIDDWYIKHQEYINRKSLNPDMNKPHSTQELLGMVYLSIKSSLPYMLDYLSDSDIPETADNAKGFFYRLKEHIDVHRGLTLNNRINFIKWYVFLSLF